MWTSVREVKSTFVTVASGVDDSQRSVARCTSALYRSTAYVAAVLPASGTVTITATVARTSPGRRRPRGSVGALDVAKVSTPAATIARTFETNSSNAPAARSGAPCPRHTPTTASGGTSEIAMATPGSTAATSRRDRAIAPANPVATAATRSTSPGEVRLAIWLLLSSETSWGTASEKTTPIATTTAPPRTT